MFQANPANQWVNFMYLMQMFVYLLNKEPYRKGELHQ